MDADRARPLSGPAGRLVERIGDHVSSARQLLAQSDQAVERVTARVQQTHRRLQRRSNHLPEGLVVRQVAWLGDRLLAAKRRELAAHLAAVALHEQAAALQERLGYPERAAVARAHAEQARQWYQLAGQELADYQARLTAGKGGAGKTPGQPT